MHKHIHSLRSYVSRHKKRSIVIGAAVVVVFFFVGKSVFKKDPAPTYVLGSVERGTVVSSISGTGQISSNRTIELKPKVSGDITYVAAKAGQELSRGSLIAQIDSSDAQKSVRDAQVNLESAKLSLEKIEKPADALDILQAENALAQAQAALSRSYEDAFNSVSNAFLDIPSIVTSLDNTLHGTDVNASTSGQWNSTYYAESAHSFETTANDGRAYTYRDDAETKYQKAKAAYDKNFSSYKNASRLSDEATISNLLNETYDTARLVADAVKSTQNLLQYYQDTLTAAGRTIVQKSNTQLSSLSTNTGKINSDVSNLLSAKNSIRDANYSVPEKQGQLDDLKNGADSLDLRSAQLSVTQRENALADAKEKLADYSIRAPFDGTLASLDIAVGDTAGSATIGTFIAKGSVAEISLNEVDAAKVKVGQKATLTFDAIDDLSIAGSVASIDTIGTVNSGVVNYTVTIAFDTMDDRIRPGMTVSAAIVTDLSQDTLFVPSSAVKSSSSGSYVEVMKSGATTPTQVSVQTGISSDTETAILSGLTEGDSVVTRTNTQTTSTQTTQAPSLFGSGGRTGGGNVRIQR